jgi:hypothetical protein
VRLVDLVTKIASTLIRRGAGLYNPLGLMFDHGKNLIITNLHYISQYNLQSGALVNLTGSLSDGFSDGPLSQAKFYVPLELLSLTESIILVTDDINKRVRLINMATGTVSSICTGATGTVDGSTNVCQLRSSASLLVKHGLIYIGEYTAIRTLPFCKHDFGLPTKLLKRTCSIRYYTSKI